MSNLGNNENQWTFKNAIANRLLGLSNMTKN